MNIRKTYNGYTGKELLAMVSPNGDAVDLAGETAILIPRILPFANQAQIAEPEDADYVSVETRTKKVLVRI